MTHAAYDTCAIGNAIIDIIADSDDAFLQRHEVVKGAMTLIDEARAEFLYSQIKPMVQMSGGSAANTAAGIAALGGKACYIGKVRDDALGEHYRRDMQKIGVDFLTSPTTKGPATARCMIIVTPDGERSMNTYLGACVDLTKADVDPAQIKASQITYMEGYLFDKPEAQEAFYLAAKIAREAGRKSAITLSDSFCVARHREDFLNLLNGHIDILMGNDQELTELYQTSSLDAAIASARTHCAVVVATRGEKGAVLADANGVVEVKAVAVPKVVDTTGAGDLFASGVLYGLTHGHSLADSGLIAARAAAEVISHHGPRPVADLKPMAVI